MLPLEDQPCVFIDLQTTGASPRFGEVLEVAWCSGSARDGQAAAESLRSMLVAPSTLLPKVVARITGITTTDLAAACDLASVLAALREATAGGGEAVCHVARFEAAFLRPLWHEHFQTDLPPMLCTYELAKRLMPQLPSFSLRAVAGSFGHATTRERRATSHALATAAAWRGLCQLLRGTTSVRTLPELRDWLLQTPAPRATRSYPLARQLRLSLPEAPGIYRMCDGAGRVLYVGKAQSLKARVNSYFRQRRGHGAGKLEMLSQVVALTTQTAATGLEAALLENDEIKRLDPPYNTALRALSRRAYYVDRSLAWCEPQRGRRDLIGPFANRQEMALLARMQAYLQGSATAAEIASELFIREVAEATLAAGFQLLSEEHGLKADISLRSLMAIGVRLALAQKRSALDGDAVPEETHDDDKPEALHDDKPKALHDDDEPEALHDDDKPETLASPAVSIVAEHTPDTVKQRLAATLHAAGRGWLRSRAIKRLINSDIAWQESSGAWRTLTVRGGEILGRGWLEAVPECCPEPTATLPADASDALEQPALGHLPTDILTYDRLRILLTELNRLQQEAHKVRIAVSLKTHW